jgi:hypothetical protein
MNRTTTQEVKVYTVDYRPNDFNVGAYAIVVIRTGQVAARRSTYEAARVEADRRNEAR